MDRTLTPDQATELVLERCAALGTGPVALDAALGRRLARDIELEFDLPRFANSAMDGFALRAEDCAQAEAGAAVTLRVIDESRAGHAAANQIEPGCAARISTGAAMPEGADTVVRIEDCEVGEGTVTIHHPLPQGKDVRPAGDDLSAGTRVLGAGASIAAGEIAMLATAGLAEAECFRRPNVAVLATGDELCNPGEQLGGAQIYDSNSHMIAALARESGGRVVAAGSGAPDDLDGLRERLRSLLTDTDVVIVSGGVSVGVHDHVKQALAAEGVEQVFWQVALRPGHPAWFGVRPRAGGRADQLVFGLPGNAVSAYVTFLMFARPALIALAGGTYKRRTVRAIFDDSYAKRPGDVHVVRVALTAREDGLHASLTAPNQRSHALSSLLAVDGLAILECERGDVVAGERVDVEVLLNSSDR